jgi:hypothetical protein
MSEFQKRLVLFVVAAVLLFAVGAAITWFKVNEYDEGEFVMNTAQAAASALLVVFLAQLKSVFGVFLLAVLLAAQPAEAGLFSRIFNRGCPNGQCSRPAPQKAAPKYRYECKNGTCRQVEIKQ